MPRSSLIVVDGDQTADDAAAYEYAELAGVTFIQLRHKAGAARTTWSARGFQGLTVRVSENREGGRSFKANWTQRNGEDCRAHRPLVFEPEGRTRILTAYLPDSPFNRDKLAGFYYEQACFWVITDPAILAEVKKAADEKKANAPKGPSQAEVIDAQADEIAVLRKRLEEETKRADSAEEKAEVVSKARRVVKELPSERLGAIEEIVHEQNADVISALQTQSPKGWRKLKRYQELIQPQIDEMVETELEKMNADHAGVGV